MPGRPCHPGAHSCHLFLSHCVPPTRPTALGAPASGMLGGGRVRRCWASPRITSRWLSPLGPAAGLSGPPAGGTVLHSVLGAVLPALGHAVGCGPHASSCTGWDRVNFLHNNWYGAVFWICAENSVDNTGMFQLWLSRAYTVSRPFLLLTPPHQPGGWGCPRSWEGTQPGQLTPTDQRDIPYRMTSCAAYKAGGRRRKGGTFGVMAICWSEHRLSG